MAEKEKRERFGRYLILDHLVDGGMAKICRARFLGEQADKIVAIKMVQPQFSRDDAFKTMFMDEIKLTFGLLHPNVIQTYDYGLHNGQLYVAMEYCDGKNLKQYLEKLKELNKSIPVQVAVFVVSQACQGLFYAHTFKDKFARVESGIIHRDISPHNIMLTYDGAVKIIDFGIAKSKTNSEATQAGTIKGKLSYLAPEYLEGGVELDARYDQFALGITFWELLCSRKLFSEKNDLAVLKKIQECKVPAPSSINPLVPKELDDIVLKALSRDREERFENLDQMNRALMKFLYAKYPDFNSIDASNFARGIFKDEIKADHERLYAYGKIELKPFIEDYKKEMEGGGSAEREVAEEDQGPKKVAVLDFGFEETPKAKPKSAVAAKKVTASGKVAVKEKTEDSIDADQTQPTVSSEVPESTSVISKAASGTTRVQRTSSIKKSDKTGSKTKIGKVETSKKDKSGSKKGGAGIAVVAAMLAVLVGVGYYVYQSLEEPSADVASTSTPTTSPKARVPAQETHQDKHAEVASKPATLVLSHFDKQKMQAFIDGEKIELNHLSSVSVPTGKDFTLRVQVEGKMHFVKQLNLSESVKEIEIPEMPNMAYAYMTTSSACANGELRFEVFGEKRVSPIPMKESFGIALPLHVDEKGQLAPKTYEILFKRNGEEIERKIEISVTREDQTIDLCEQF